MTLLLGCIADDLTGATDLGSMLVRNGMRTLQWIGVPQTPMPDEYDAAIVALKSRTIPPDAARTASLQALRWLADQGAEQFLFKYCSTFDSTDKGNIGPVTDALLDELGEDFTICCPAFPTNARTVYQGHLFVGDVPLAESGMRNHPLTPMTDSNLVRLLGRQASGKVGLIPNAVIEQGASAIRARMDQLRSSGVRYAIVDALSDVHLHSIGAACAGMKLVTGGSGVAMGLAANFAPRVTETQTDATNAGHATAGFSAVIAGSCSPATLRQVDVLRETVPAFQVDPFELANGTDIVTQALGWAAAHLGTGPVLIYASAPPQAVSQSHKAFGRDTVGALVEQALAHIARGLIEAGVRRLIVAGGETAGAVVEKLAVTRLQIGPEIDPGVPWTFSPADPPLWLALKSGNFGGPDFFARAFARLS